jgi:uncharacterized protein (TIGR02147 family)
MKSSIFEYLDYKSYLCGLISSSSQGGRGKRKEMAEAIRCQVSHVSMVLSGDGHFSQEQAESIARFFGLTSVETEYLLVLLQYNRAATKTLKSVYRNMLSSLRIKHDTLGNHLKMSNQISPIVEMTYHSSWHYAAIHVLISIKDYQTRDAISKRLKISLARCDEILQFLIANGFCIKEGIHYLPSKPLLHLEKDSPSVSKLHSNWRNRAIQSYDEITQNNFHYSGAFSVSQKDLPKLKKILNDALSQFMSTVVASGEEEIAALCIDLFPL